jgi:hypothetical protein
VPYSGTGKNPYWMSVTYGGTANPAAISEKFPVVVDNLTTYALYTSTQWENGTNNITIQLVFQDATGATLSTISSAGLSVTNSALAQYNTVPTVAPANAASAQAIITHNVQNDNLRVYFAAVQTAANTAQPSIVNKNYTFLYTYDPWTAQNNALLQWNFNPLVTADGDTDSLVIDDAFELMGGQRGVECTIPELTDTATGRGTIFRIGAPGGSVGLGGQGPYDLGTPQPTADVVESLLLDGERPFGRRASNRKITIPVVIFSPTLTTLAAAREFLLKAIDQQTWKLTWRPGETGLALEFECFRADPSVVTYGFNYNRPGASGSGTNTASYAQSVVTLSFQALPYGKSGQDGIRVVNFTDGILDAGAVATSVLVDDYSVPSTFNDFAGGTNGVTISAANSGTANGHTEVAFTSVALGAGTTATYSNTSPPSGSTQSAALNTGASSSTVKLQYNTSRTNLKQYFQFYFKAAAYPASGRINMLFVGDVSSNLLTRMGLRFDGKFSMDSNNVSDALITTGTVPLNTWVRVSGFVSSSATAGQMGFSLYYTNTEGNSADESKTSAATLNTFGTAPGVWQFGVTNAGFLNYAYNVGNVEFAGAVPFTAYSASPTFFSPGGGTWTKNTAYAIAGSYSARYQAPVPMTMPWAPAQYSVDGLSLNLTGLTSIYLWFGQSYDTQWPVDKTFMSNVTLTWTLTDKNGRTLSFSGKHNKCPWGADPNKPSWIRIASAIPQGRTKAQFDYANVTAYTVKVTNWAGSGTTGYVRMHAWISQALAVASTAKWITTPHASVYSVFGLNGIARSPMSAVIQLPASNPVTQELTQAGTWLVPRGVTQVAGEAWGGGGGGGSVSGVASGMDAGGGGGSEYAAESVITTIPGTKVPVTIGAGGSGGQVVVRTVTFTRPGVNTWTVPSGVTNITAEMWGGGAAGAAGGGGGGGGCYTKGTTNVTAGTTLTFNVGKGGVANTGRLAKDQAARHGSDTVVRGATGTLHAPGGSSSVVGGTNGGTGSPKFATVESGCTITLSTAGGNGGNSPGGAGGGGGTSGGRTANGIRGGDSPRGSNNYASGGPATVTSDGGGNGGKGADVGGTPTRGSQPGGGGGGGYTKGVANYSGAAGGDGKIIITYQENLGNPVNGGQTVFGQAGLTGKVLTANGGSSPALNSAVGGAGGTGSSNTVHFNGGKGAMSGNNSDYLYRQSDNGGASWKRQAVGQATGTAVTSGTATGNVTTGLSVVAAQTTNPVSPTTATVADLAGNQYDMVSSAQIPSGVYLSTWVAKIGAPVVSGATTVTLTIAGGSAVNTIAWFTTPQYADIDFANIATGTGTSSAPAVTWSNPDVGSRKGTFIVTLNNGTVDTTALPANTSWLTSDTTTSSKYAPSSVEFAFFSKEMPGAAGTVTATSTLASSTGWAMIALPVIPQDVADPYPLKVGTTTGTGTTSAVPFANAFGVPAGRGYMLLTCHFAGTPGTITFTDATGNTWTQLTTVTIGTSVLRAYTAPATTAYTTASSVTLNDTTSQAHRTTLYYMHEALGIDASLTKTATGTSSAPSITTNAPSLTSDLQLVIFANNNTVDPTADPAGFVNWGNESNGAQHATMYAVRVPARTTYVATGAYLASQTWGAIALGFSSNIALGAGGSSGGPLGAGNDGTDSGGSAWEGGGKGAGALVSSTAGTGNPAAVPGGGGSGAASSDTSSFVGGSGASGMVRLTWTPPLKPFNDLILHRPGEGSKNSLSPVVTIPPNDPPDNREYALPSLVPGKNAEFLGTYTVLLVANAWNTATTGSSRRVSVTVNQYEYVGGPAVSAQATKVITPATDIVNGYVDMGSLTLPIKDYDEADDEVYYTISVHDTDTGDSFQDVIFLDVTGQTVLVNIAPGTAADSLYSTFYIDEPTFDKALGQVLGSGHGRERSTSVLDMAMLTGGPLYLNSGENLLLAYSTGGAPNLGVTYVPRWYTDRVK